MRVAARHPSIDIESTMLTSSALLRSAALCAGVAIAALTSTAARPAHAAEAVASVRLYTVDCGRVDISDMASLADTGEYDGKPGKLVAPCFIVRHPKGTLLWDTGLGDKLADVKEGVVDGPFHSHVDTRLSDQMKAIGLGPADIDYVSFSHLHFDHTGNANLFGGGTTWLLSKPELDWAVGNPTPFGVDPASFSAYKTAKLVMIGSDHDVFGDGSVRILAAPGHTPGHKVLLLKLQKSGAVMLSGDLYHTIENRKHARMPAFNTSRAETLASFSRIETIVKNTRARFVIQHAPESFASMPKFPAYLE